MNEFIYILRPTRPAMLATGPTDQERAAITRHVDHLKALAERGVVVLAGRTTTDDHRVFGIVILRTESAAAAQLLMSSDPAVAESVMSAELFPFRIAIASKESA